MTQLLDTHFANVDLNFLDQAKKLRKVLKDVINCFNIVTTSAFVFLRESSERKTICCTEGSQLFHKAREHHKSAVKNSTHLRQRYLNNEWYPQNLQSQDIAQEK